MRFLVGIVGLALLAFCGTPAEAQSTRVVDTCPSSQMWTVGDLQRPLLLDKNGILCSSSSGGGGGATYNQDLTVTPTVANSSHAAGSSLGGLQTMSFFRTSGQPSGILNNVQWIWKSGALQAVTVYVFSANPSGSTCTDASAISIASADMSKLIAGSPFTLSPSVIGSGSTLSVAYSQSPISVKNTDGVATTNLYVCVAINTTATPTANDGILRIAGPQD